MKTYQEVKFVKTYAIVLSDLVQSYLFGLDQIKTAGTAWNRLLKNPNFRVQKLNPSGPYFANAPGETGGAFPNKIGGTGGFWNSIENAKAKSAAVDKAARGATIAKKYGMLSMTPPPAEYQRRFPTQGEEGIRQAGSLNMS
jgi:hypothetical protein